MCRREVNSLGAVDAFEYQDLILEETQGMRKTKGAVVCIHCVCTELS